MKHDKLQNLKLVLIVGLMQTFLSFSLNISVSLFLFYPYVSHPAGLKDILHMVSSQWDQLQRQIRRQHGWMLRAVRCIQARLLYTSQSYELFTALGDPSANQQALCPADGLKVENFFFFFSQFNFIFFCYSDHLALVCFLFFGSYPSISSLADPSYPPLSFYHTPAHSQINNTHLHSVVSRSTFLCIVCIN